MPENERPEGGGRGMRPPGEFSVGPLKPQPYLGIVTAPVPPALQAQLGIPEGFGLVVEEVLPESPAKTAGIERHDVLRAFNDQHLIVPDQLAALVRAAGKDAEATLTLIRKGEEKKVTVKIGERDLPDRQGHSGTNLPRHGGELQERFPALNRNLEDAQRRLGEFRDRSRSPQPGRAPERLREYRRQLEEWQERLREWAKKPNGEMPKAPEPPQFESSNQPQPPVHPTEFLRGQQPGGPGQVTISSENSSSTWDGSRARLTMKEADGEIEIAGRDGQRILTARTPQGETVFTGPVDKEEQREKVPEPFRRKLFRLLRMEGANLPFPQGEQPRIGSRANPGIQ